MDFDGVLGVDCILASWGYANAEQIRIAHEIGIKIANPKNLIDMLS